MSPGDGRSAGNGLLTGCIRKHGVGTRVFETVSNMFGGVQQPPGHLTHKTQKPPNDGHTQTTQQKETRHIYQYKFFTTIRKKLLFK